VPGPLRALRCRRLETTRHATPSWAYGRALGEVEAAAGRMGREMPEPEGLQNLLAGSLDAARWDDVSEPVGPLHRQVKGAHEQGLSVPSRPVREGFGPDRTRRSAPGHLTAWGAPKFTGAFYTKDLTGPAGSALADTAWNALINDRVARTAVDNGQATLGRLLSGLQAQEEKQNWPSLSNMAGYVGGESANLKDSVAGEQDAITMYGQFAAKAAGDPATASAFKEYRADEQGHLKVFSYQLQHLKH
jgi:hypothetical protein